MSSQSRECCEVLRPVWPPRRIGLPRGVNHVAASGGKVKWEAIQTSLDLRLVSRNSDREGDRHSEDDVIVSAASLDRGDVTDADDEADDEQGVEFVKRFTAIEICAGGGGQALGLEQAGFGHAAVVEIDSHACQTLRANRPDWNVLERDLREFSGKEYKGIDLLAGGVPCPPFSIAGKQLGRRDERDLFPEALRLVEETQPKAVMLENVRGLAAEKFAPYRAQILEQLDAMGYVSSWRLVNSSDYGVPQLRPRFVLVALKRRLAPNFRWPEPSAATVTVADAIGDLVGSRGWRGATAWKKKAAVIAPTVVGGSKKHGGPDLGPTRARRQWLELGVDGLGVANEPPGPEHPANKPPRLTVQMVARIQGFPDEWKFAGGKTAAYRQVGNAFPPPVAKAISAAILSALRNEPRRRATRLAGESSLELFGAAR